MQKSLAAEASLPCGLYERLLDEELAELLAARPDLIATLATVDDESTPQSYSQFLWQLLRRALPIAKPEHRIELVNRLIELLAAQDGLDYTRRKLLLQPGDKRTLLHELRVRGEAPRPRPATPLSISSLLTGQGDDPPLEHELRAEMVTADRVDILVSFVKFAGLRLLRPAFEDLATRGIPVRIITTSLHGSIRSRSGGVARCAAGLLGSGILRHRTDTSARQSLSFCAA